jgi:hypothetical protein
MNPALVEQAEGELTVVTIMHISIKSHKSRQ